MYVYMYIYVCVYMCVYIVDPFGAPKASFWDFVMEYVLLEGRLYFFRLVLHLPHCLFSFCIRLSQSRILVFSFYFSSLVNCFHSLVLFG